MPIPAHTRNYFARRNSQYNDNATLQGMARSIVWQLKANLMDQLTTGATGPNSRHANSIWTCIGSSNGAAAGMDAVDRWGSSYTPGNLIWAGSGVARSWIVLQNTTLGLQFLIELQGSSGTDYPSILFAFTRTAEPFSGGSITASPRNLTFDVNANFTSGALGNYYTWITDVTTGNTNYCNFVTAPNGSFFFFTTRQTIGFATGGIGLHKTEASSTMPISTGDTRNYCFLSSGGTTSTPGWPTNSLWQAASACSQRVNAGTYMTAGGIGQYYFGNTQFGSTTSEGADPLTLDYNVAPLTIHTMTPQAMNRGVIPDVWIHSNRSLLPPGTVNDPSGVVRHVVLGDFFIPWDGSAPTM